MKKHTLLVLLLVIAAVAVILALLIPPRGKEDTGENSSNQSKETEPKVVKKTAAEIIAEFPPGLPLERDAVSTDSFEYLPPASPEQQYTLQYISVRSFADNSRLFKEYLTKNKLTMKNSVAEKDLTFYYAVLDKNDLSIKIEPRDKTSVVTVSYLKRP